MMMSRPFNALEALFVQCNIRFAAGVVFEPVSVDRAETALRTGLQVCGLDRLRVASPLEEESWPRVSLLETSSSSSAEPHHETTTKTLTQTLEELVARDTPAIGGVSTYLLIIDCDDDDSLAIGFVINANHVLCDGRLMKTCIEAALQRLMGIPSPSIELLAGTLGDLQSLLEKKVVPLEPRFLPLKGSSTVKLNEMPNFVADIPSAASLAIRSDIDAPTVTACRHQLQSKGTVTGFMMACWIQAISEVAGRTGIAATSSMTDAAIPIVSISCLVDIRSQLPPAVLYTNAFGTVTVSGAGLLLPNDKTQQGQKNHYLSSFLIDLAESCTQDLQTRIHRGEALLQSLALCRGEFDGAGPPGTIELSNHGVYSTTGCTRELALQQRFDDYDGVSVSMVSESNSGVLRLTVNAGDMFRRAAIVGLMDRVVELWGVVAAQEVE